MGITGVLIAATSLFMAALMFSLQKNALNRIWGAFCIAVFVWGISFYFVATRQTPEEARLWWKISHIGVILIPVFFTHFVYVFLQQKSRFSLPGVYAVGVFFLFADLATTWLIHDMRFVFGEFFYDSPPGFLYLPFFLYFQGLIIYGHYLLLRAYLASKDLMQREQIRYFFMATFVGFLGGGISFSPVFGIDIYPTTTITVTLYPVIMGFAILRFKLFDMRVASAQLLSLAIFIFGFIKIFSSASPLEYAFNIGMMLLSLVIGVYLVQSVRKEIEQREMIEAQEKQLQVSNQQQESLLHFISHEIKGYLTKNEAAFDAIRVGDYGEVSPQLHEMSATALEDTRKGVATVIDILDASNLKRGTVSYNKKDFDLCHAIEEIVADLQKDATAKGLTLTFHKPVSGVCMFNGDEDKLRRHVIRNVIDNSIKYTPSGSVSVDMAKTDRVYRITVKDTGVGITAEDMARLFTEGGHGKDSIKINVHSTGFGLYIAKQVTEVHGGKIWAESEGSGKGSRFIIELPLH